MQEILVNVDKQRNKTIVVVENGRLVEKYQENDGAERQLLHWQWQEYRT